MSAETKQLIGRNIIFRSTIGSTNDLAKRLAKRGAAEGTVVIADEQTRGRGRYGRNWHSPKHLGLWLSIVLRPQIPPKQVSVFSFLPAVAISRTIATQCGINTSLKWPNDVLINGKKVAGILSEAIVSEEQVRSVILGMGINLRQRENDFDLDLRGKATSISLETGMMPSLSDFMIRALCELDALYKDIKRAGISFLIGEWKKMAWGLGKFVRIVEGNRTYYGRFEDISDNGGIILRINENSTQTFASGECSLKGAEDYVANS